MANKIKAVTRFEAEDGSIHHTREEAIRHNSTHKCMKNTKTIINQHCPAVNTPIHIDLVNNLAFITALRDQLNKTLEHHRNYGKLKKSKA